MEVSLITTEKARAEIALRLTQEELAIQAIQDRADSLVYNEDEESLKEIQGVLTALKKVGKTIDDTHEVGKKPYLEGGRKWDEAKRHYSDLVREIETHVRNKYTILCNGMERKKREKAQKEANEKAIRQGVESNILTFASRIADAKTFKELTAIESAINLQKSPSMKAKYGDLHEEAIALYDEKLLPLLKQQKDAVKLLEKTQAELINAERYGDGGAINELQDRAAVIADNMQETKVRVQETALNVNFAAAQVVEPIVPTVKAKRTTIKFKLVDVEAALKRSRNLLTIELNSEACKEAAKNFVEAKIFDKQDSVELNGIVFYVEKTY